MQNSFTSSMHIRLEAWHSLVAVLMIKYSAFKDCLNFFCVRPTKGHLANIFVAITGLG